MAKKPSSRAKNSRRSVDKSEAKGGGIMSINKAHTSPFMKVVLVIIIISMVTLFLAGGIVSFVDLFSSQPKAPAQDPIAAIQSANESKVQAFTTALASQPTSYTLLVGLANARYDYAIQLMDLVSKGTTSAMSATVTQWSGARDAFAKAWKINKTDKSVGTDYSVALFYSGETTSAIKIVSGVIKQDPTYPAAYFNLGIFYDSQNKATQAIEMYTKYLSLDAAGKYGNRDYANQRIKALGGSSVTSATPITTGTATTTSP